MKITIIFKVVKYLYNHGFRQVVIEFINNPNNTWDEAVVSALDELFDYKEAA